MSDSRLGSLARCEGSAGAGPGLAFFISASNWPHLVVTLAQTGATQIEIAERVGLSQQ